jgi:cytochrome c nitrite reductase small subunit
MAGPFSFSICRRFRRIAVTRSSRYLGGVSVLALILCLGVGIALGTGGYTYYYGEGFSYFSSNPAACVNCHIMRDHYDGWQKASHHAVATCNDCHTPHNFVGKYYTKAENGFWHSYAFTLQNFHDPLLIRPKNSAILERSCIHCHDELVHDILGHGDIEDGGASNCVRCHASVGHGPAK